MNITDVTAAPPPGDKLELIFQRQRELMEKYHPIEKANGLLLSADVPVDLNDKYGQARLKDFAWRITEEIAEAMEALETHPELPEHFLEEVVDSFHFLIELLILIGIDVGELTRRVDRLMGLFPLVLGEVACTGEGTVVDTLEKMFNLIPCPPKNTPIDPEDVGRSVVVVITSLGKSMNCLKQKPWKQAHMITDPERFKSNIALTFYHFLEMAKGVGLTPQDLFNLYFRKSEVNKFRQRSGY